MGIKALCRHKKLQCICPSKSKRRYLTVISSVFSGLDKNKFFPVSYVDFNLILIDTLDFLFYASTIFRDSTILYQITRKTIINTDFLS